MGPVHSVWLNSSDVIIVNEYKVLWIDIEDLF